MKKNLSLSTINAVSKNMISLRKPIPIIIKDYIGDSDFCNIYPESKNIHKMNFRYFCYNHLDQIRQIYKKTHRIIRTNNDFSAVIVEFRSFPHIEFLLLNAIIKLGAQWNFVIVCGNKNYDFVKEMCARIDPNIIIIKLDYDNINTSTYSALLGTTKFWETLPGKKILIYQEDSCIFKTNINDFIDYDYIGAPFRRATKGGNGGLSLRTKQTMIDVITKEDISIANLPEDIYFSKIMEKYGIGKISGVDAGSRFSIECIYKSDSFAGHAFWKCTQNWKKLIIDACLQ